MSVDSVRSHRAWSLKQTGMTVGATGLLEKLFFLPRWKIGVAEASLDTVLRGGRLPAITWWTVNSSLDFQADPFFLGDHILFERMNYWRGRGEIWIADAVGERRGRFIRTPSHVSYPCVTKCHARTFLLYESSTAGKCRILELTGTNWTEVSCIDQPVVDGTLLCYGGRYWVFGTLAGDGVNRDLYVWWAESIEGPWRSHKANPVKQDPSSSRPAGGFFHSSMGLIRPAQDCATVYGGAIVLSCVQHLDEERFEETFLIRLPPVEGFVGIHTINVNGHRIVVDGKQLVFHPLASLLKLRSLAFRRKFGIRQRSTAR